MPGKEILVASGKADHFVRKDRTQDEQHVVIANARVDPHGHVERKQALRQFPRLGGRQHVRAEPAPRRDPIRD